MCIFEMIPTWKKTHLAHPDQLNLYIAGMNNQRFRPRAVCWPVIVCMYTCTHMDVCVCVCAWLYVCGHVPITLISMLDDLGVHTWYIKTR